MADSTAYARYNGLTGSSTLTGVISLNTLTGALTLAAGSGMSITPSGGNTLTIASTSAGDLTLTAFGSTPNANAASLSGQALTLQPADGSNPGGVSTTTQTFAGQKTFSTGLTGTLTGAASLNVLTSALGNLTDAGTDGITVTGGTAAVVGTVSLSQHVADTTHNGYLSSTDWNTFNNKQTALTLTNLTDAGTDGITITNGTGAVVGASPVTIAQHVADTTHNGYLSSTDWNTFNGKQATVSIGALDAQAENANGLALVSNVLSAQSADGTHPGMVNTGIQTFAGNKTFSGTIGASNLSGTNTGDQSVETLTDVIITSVAVSDILSWNGVDWVNGPPAVQSGGPGVSYYQSTPTIIATGANNTLVLNTFTTTPTTTTQQTIATTISSTTSPMSAWLYATALGRTVLDSGAYAFNEHAAVNSVAAGRVTTITGQMYQVQPAVSGTVTVTGSGTSRTVTASANTPFAATGFFAASATNTVASYLQTTQGLYQITARTSNTVVTIATPSGYSNESAVTYNVWNLLFGVTSAAITGITPTYQNNVFSAVEPSFAVATTDQLGKILFGTSNNTTIITTVYNGTTNNSFVQTPFLVLHDNLDGLQGGSAGQYFHLTSAEYTGTGSGNFVRATSPVLTTPNLGTPSTLVGTNISGTASSLTAGGNTTYSANNHGVVLSGTANAMTVIAPNASTAFPLVSGGSSADPTWAGLTVAGGGTGVVANTAYAVLCGGTTTTGAIQSIAAVGSSGQVLTSNGAAALPTFQTAAAALTSPYELINSGFSCTASSNILTFALKQSDGSTDPSSGTAAVKVAMRSSTAGTGGYNERSITAALSQTFTAGTTCGLGAQAQDLYLYLIDSDGAGTMKLGASAVLYDETTLQTTIAESQSATATSANPAVFTANSHGLTLNDGVLLSGTPPTGFSANTLYYAKVITTNTFQLAGTPGGTSIASSSTGSSIVVHYGGYKIASAATYTSMPVRCVGKINSTFSTLGNWPSPNSAAVIQKIPARQDISMRLTNSSTSISGSAATIVWTNIAIDTLNICPSKTSAVIPIAGDYQINAAIYSSSTGVSTDVTEIIIQKNGSNMSFNLIPNSIVGSVACSTAVSDILNLAQNDLITIQFLNQNTSPTITSNTSGNYFSLTKVGN